MKAPSAKKIPQKITYHDHTRIDNYYWLNQKENPAVLKYLRDENKYLEKGLKHLDKLRDELYHEIIGRIKPDDQTVPYFDNGYFYYTRYPENTEYPVYCRKIKSLDSPEQIILDVNELASEHNYYHVGSLAVSPDNQLLAFSADTLSRRIYTIFLKDLETNMLLDQEICYTSGDPVWANDNATLFYTIKDETLRPYKIMMKNILDNHQTATQVLHEKDPAFALYVSKSKSEKYIFAQSWSTLSSEIHFLSADNNEIHFTLFHKREKDHLYTIEHRDNSFYILSNKEALNFKLLKTHEDNTTKDHWEEIIIHREDTLIEDFELFDNFLVLIERKNALPQLHVIEEKTDNHHYIEFNEPAFDVHLSTNKEMATSQLNFVYNSLTIPQCWFSYNMINRERILLKQEEVLGNFDSSNYKSERIFIESSDGKKIPLSLVYKNDLDRSQPHPLLLYGYGSYGINIDPTFHSSRLSLIDRGFIYVIAHIRGGQEMGRWWYEDGKLEKKQNTFNDFISCAEALLYKKYTTREKLFAMGGSAGGLLIGAVLNQRPDLWKGLLAAVPFVDVLTTMLDETIPLTTGEFDEWGNPKNRVFYNYILNYSPYDNIESKDYPALLVTTGLHDSQVQYWEPAKWVAKLRAKKTDTNPLYLYTEMESGHSGASGRFKKYKTLALQYAFILNLLKGKE